VFAYEVTLPSVVSCARLSPAAPEPRYTLLPVMPPLPEAGHDRLIVVPLGMAVSEVGEAGPLCVFLTNTRPPLVAPPL
jgi:hypothetical protein